MSLSRLNKQNLDFYLNQRLIHGVQDIRASCSAPIEHVKFLGMNSSFYTPEGSRTSSLSITSLLTSHNEFLSCSGESGNFGFITKKDNPSNNILFGFESGYLSSYTCSAQIGQIPTVAANFEIFRDAGVISDTIGALGASSAIFNPNLTPSLVNTNTIDISIGDFSTNRVNSFTLTLNILRDPQYYLGATSPFSVRSVYPIEISCEFSIVMDDYSIQKMSDFAYNIKRNDNFYIKAKDFNGNSVNFDFSNSLCYFIDFSEDASFSVNSPASATIRYKGYLK